MKKYCKLRLEEKHGFLFFRFGRTEGQYEFHLINIQAQAELCLLWWMLEQRMCFLF